MRFSRILTFSIITLLGLSSIHGSPSNPLIHGLVQVVDGQVEFPLPERTIDCESNTYFINVDTEEKTLWFHIGNGNRVGYTCDITGKWRAESGLAAKRHYFEYDSGSDTYLQIGVDGLTKKYQRVITDGATYYLTWENLPNGTHRCYGYDDKGRLSEMCDRSISDEILSSVTWEHSDSRFNHTTADGLRFAFDTLEGHIVRVEAPDKGLYRYSYGLENKLTQYDLPNGYFYRFTYDLHGRVTELEAPTSENGQAKTLATFRYDEGCTEVIDALGKTVKYYHDGQHVTFRDDGLRSERFTWNADDQLTSVTLLDDAGNTVSVRTFGYDGLGNLESETLQGNLSGTDANGFEEYKTWYAYDELQRIIRKVQDNGTFSLYSYFAKTNLISVHQIGDPTGIKLRTIYTYDSAGRCEDTTHDDGQGTDLKDLSGVTHRTSKSTLYADGKPLLIDQKYYDLEKGEEVIQQTYMHIYHLDGRLAERHNLDAEGVCQQSSHFGYDVMGRVSSLSGQAETIKQYRYDTIGHVTQARDSNGVLLATEYDLAGRPIVNDITDSKSRKFHQSKKYDANGNVASSIDIFGNETSYVYDALGRLIETCYPSILSPAGAVKPTIKRTYNAQNRVATITDPLGFITQINYTARGNPYRIVYPDGTYESFQYALDGSLLKVRSRNGIETKFERDFLDRVVQKTFVSEEGHQITAQATYTPFYLKHMIDPMGNQTSLTHDAAGRITSTIFEWASGSATKEYAYDTHNNITSIKQPFDTSNYREMRFQRDDKDQPLSCAVLDQYEQTLISSNYHDPLKERQDKAQLDEDYQHANSLGQRVLQTKATDEAGVMTVTTYDALGHIAEIEQRDSFGATLTLSRYLYDAAGNRIKEAHGINSDIIIENRYGSNSRLESTTEASRTTHYLYNDKGLLKRVLKPDGVELILDYDGMGRVQEFLSSDNTVHYTYLYDDVGRPTQVTDHVTGSTQLRIYHALGGIEHEVLDRNLAISHSFDEQGRPLSLTLPDNTHVIYEYDAARLIALHRHRSIGESNYTHRYTEFTAEGQPTEAKLIGNAGAAHWTYDVKGRCESIETAHWSQRVLERDFRGNVKKSHIWNSSDRSTKAYAYDALGRLVNDASTRYEYNSIGNRLKAEAQHYDANGNISKRLTSNGTQNLHYDALNRLIEVVTPSSSRVCYHYDAFDRRLSMTVYSWKEGCWKLLSKRRYIYDGNREIGAVDENDKIVELRILGQGIAADIGAAVAIEINGRAFAAIHDSRGSVVSLTDAENGSLVEAYEYTAFGEEIDPPIRPISPWRFSSKRVDDETDLVYFGKRYYDPAIGQWITPDPLGTTDGPNRYAFVHNNPLNQIDAEGLFSLDTAWQWLDSWAKNYWQEVSSFSMTKFFYGNIVTDILINFRIVAQELIGPGLFLLAGLHGEPIEFGVYGEGEINDRVRLSHVNGVLNMREGALASAKRISKTHGGVNVHYLYRPTAGWTGDILNGLMALVGYASPTAKRLAEGWHELIEAVGGVGNGGVIIHYAHSLGGAETACARGLMTPEEQKMIRVTTFGSAKVLSDEGFAKVHNYISWYDVVMGFDAVAYFNAATSSTSNVTFLTALGYFVVDHRFGGPTYSKLLDELGQRFVALYGSSY